MIYYNISCLFYPRIRKYGKNISQDSIEIFLILLKKISKQNYEKENIFIFSGVATFFFKFYVLR